MALTLTELQTLRDELQRKLFSGTRSVQDGSGQSLTNAATEEMQVALRELDNQIAAASSSRIRQVRGYNGGNGF